MITVLNTNDSGAGSLRQAIADAAVGEEIQFAVTGIITLSSAELIISQDLVITGPGSSLLTIDGDGAFRCFNTDTGVISISGLTILNGAGALGAGLHNEATLAISDVIVTDCVSSNSGGGIWNSGTITSNGLLVETCSAGAGDGGGIHNTGTITATDLRVTGCTSSGDGAGIWSNGTFTHFAGSVTNNTAAGVVGGGGIYNAGTYTPTELEISGNSTGGNGGGIYNTFGTVTITRCTTSNNTVGIYNNSGTLAMDNSTVSSQTTGLYNAGGAVSITHSTIVQNTYGLTQDPGSFLEIQNTILAGNVTLDYDGDTADITSNGHNIFGVNSNPVTPAVGDQSVLTFVALVMGPLQDNGGPTFTHALLEGSPALDAGNTESAPATDQRGEPRVVNDTIDIGAYEADIAPPEPPIPPEPPEPPIPPAPTTTTSAVPDCRRVSCCNSETGEQFSDFIYSLVDGQSYTNEEMTFTIRCPSGYDCTQEEVLITIPPGTIIFTPTKLNPNPPPSGSGNPYSPSSGKYSFSCGGETLTITTDGNGFTAGQIDSIVDFLAQCQANQDGNAILLPTPVLTPSGDPGLRLWNTEQTCTVNCPEGETGDPSTVTIPARTYSVIVAQSATPLAKYLAQQELNTNTLAAACEQATLALDCNATAVCPEFKSSFAAGGTNGVFGCQYGLTQNYLYVTVDVAGEFNIKAFDISNVEQLTAAFPGYSGLSAGICYSVAQNQIYAKVKDTGLNENRIKVLDATDLSQVAEIDINPLISSVCSDPIYIESIDSVLVSGNSNILLIDCATNTISDSTFLGDLAGFNAAFAPNSSKYYCPVSFNPSPAVLAVRNAILVQTGTITLTGFDIDRNALVYGGGKLIAAVRSLADGTTSILVIDPLSDTVTNTVATGAIDAPFSIAYDPTFNLAYIATAPTPNGTLIVFDVATETVLCEQALVNGPSSVKQIGVNTTADRFYVPNGDVLGTLYKYGQP